nr:MAG TPA: hypothetical protein [Bacteriophage sp.]
MRFYGLKWLIFKCLQFLFFFLVGFDFCIRG